MKEAFQKFVDKSIEKLSPIESICGVAIGGSWASNEMDEHSDLDLLVVSADSDFKNVFENRFTIAESLGNHISSFTGEHVGEPKLLICLYSNPLIHVDIKFISLQDFENRVSDPWVAWERNSQLSNVIKSTTPKGLDVDPQWIEDRFWTWVHYGALKINRGEFFETIGFLDYLRETALAPLKKRELGLLPFGVRRIEQYSPSFSTELKKTIASHDRGSCILALQETINIYRELRSKIPKIEINYRKDAETESLAYFSKI